MLKENYKGAHTFYLEALELKPRDPLAHYSLAVLGARMKNEKMLGDHLKIALMADQKLIGKAIDDLEFRNFKKSPHYQQAFR